MTRFRTTLVIAGLFFTLSAPAVSAQGWGRGLLERMSGPGPFYGDDGRLTALCVSRDAGARVRPLWVVRQAGETTLFCIDVDYSNYQNEQEDRPENGLITFNRYQVALMFPVQPFLELGAGIGRARFSGSDFELSRVVIPLRASFKPLRLPGLTRALDDRRWAGIPKLEYTGMIIPQHLRTADFHVSHEFDHTYLSGFSFLLDFSELIAR